MTPHAFENLNLSKGATKKDASLRVVQAVRAAH